MWQIIPYYYADSYVVYWLAQWFHGWPHISYDGFKIYDSTFDPEDKTYIEVRLNEDLMAISLNNGIKSKEKGSYFLPSN